MNILTVNRLTIHGNERHGIVLREAPVVGMAVDGVMFIGAALRFGGHLSSNILLKNTTFEASIIEMNFTSPDWVNISIIVTGFVTGLTQKSVISMCVDNGSVNLTGYNIYTVSRHDIKLNAPQLQHCGRNSVIAADVLIDSTSLRLDTRIENSSFSRAYGMAFHYRLQLLKMDQSTSYLNAHFVNNTFRHYDPWAIALKFISIAVYINIHIIGCTL